MNFGINAAIIENRKTIFLAMAGILFLNILPMSALSPVLILLFGIIAGIFIIFILAPEDFRFLFNLYMVSFFIRVFLSYLFYYLSFVFGNKYTEGFLFTNDGWSYSLQGWQILKFAERGIKITPENYYTYPGMENWAGNITSYDYFTSFVYSITGHSPLSLFLISSLAGSLAALFIYIIGKELFSKKVARITSIFAFFWPSFIMWSTQNLKEPMIAMLGCVLILAVLYIMKRPLPALLLLAFLSSWVLFKIGAPYAIVLISMIFFTSVFLFVKHLFRHKFPVILVLGFLIFILVYVNYSKIITFISEKSIYTDIKNYKSIFEFLDYNRSVRAFGRLGFFQNADISSFGRAIAFMPLGLLYAVFAPFPWQLGSITQIIAAPETLLFYMLFPVTLKGVIFGYSKRFNQSLLLLSIIGSTLIFLGLIEGNSGTLFRHRFLAFNLLFIFTAIGLCLRRPLKRAV